MTLFSILVFFDCETSIIATLIRGARGTQLGVDLSQKWTSVRKRPLLEGDLSQKGTSVSKDLGTLVMEHWNKYLGCILIM